MQISFNITDDKTRRQIYQKIHKLYKIAEKDHLHNELDKTPNNLIFILRNPRECFAREYGVKHVGLINLSYYYFENINYFLEFEGTKKIFFMRI